MGADVDRIAEILEHAEEVHGIVTERAEGVDPDWALFYAWWLINWSDLPAALGATPAMSELTATLVRLDRDYRDASPSESWSAWYALRLADGGSSGG